MFLKKRSDVPGLVKKTPWLGVPGGEEMRKQKPSPQGGNVPGHTIHGKLKNRAKGKMEVHHKRSFFQNPRVTWKGC